MTITFDNIRWANGDQLNGHAIQSVTLDMDKHIAHINCVARQLDLPFVRYYYGGGISHHEFKVLDPDTINGCFNICIFDNGKVCAIDFSKNADKFFNQNQLRAMQW